MRFSREQELAPGNFASFHGPYALPSVAEADDEAGQGLPLLETPLLVGGESYEFAAIANLDLFFTRVYRYWHERGLSSILLAGALNLLALAFTAAFSTFLLLFVDWRALHTECLAPRAGSSGGGGSADPTGGGGGSGGGGGGCDLAAVALDRRPLLGRGFGADLLALSYISVCVAYLGWTTAHFLLDARDMREVAHFMANKLGISESKVVAMTWAEVVHRLVLVQRTTRLCIARDLDELLIVARIMRKENYLIAMINRNVVQLHLQPPPDAPRPVRQALGATLRLLGGGSGGGGSRGCPPMLTKTLEWNLRWCILDHMFDDRFRIRPEFSDVAALRRRLRLVALANLLLSPFLLLFLLAYFFMRNAERLYHHPAALGSRRWSGLARWRIRELNELPHYMHHRLSASHPAALRYVAQFPSHTLAALARFMVFVTGSFVALLLFVTFLDESVLERPLLGRQVVWWLGTMTVVLAACRTLVSEEPVAYDPERALADVVSYTHYLPRHWRGRAHTAEVQAAFLSLFRLKVALFVEELASLVTTPLVLACSLPACADSIVEFVSTFTCHVEGVGDVCSLSTFDLARHGNAKYGAPVQAEKALRSRQGKLEKSFLTFVATYPTWEPGELGHKMLVALAASGAAGGGGAAADAAGAGAGADAQPYYQDPPSVFPYQAAAGASKAAAGGAEEANAVAAATAALARAASGGLRPVSGKGGPSMTGMAPEMEGPSSSPAGATAASAAASGKALPRPPGPGYPTGPAGAFGRHRPPSSLHMQPYHGVRSYTSTASASQLSAAGGGGAASGGGVGGGWPWRPSGNMSSGGAAGGPAGGSPAPSIASSQFSNLAPPYLQYYPVPLYYAHQQQARYAAQQQHRRMYEQLLYGGMTGAAVAGHKSAVGVGPPGMPPPGSPMASPYDRPMASFGGAASWHHHSTPHPYDMYGLPYSGIFHPFPYHAQPPPPAPPPPQLATESQLAAAAAAAGPAAGSGGAGTASSSPVPPYGSIRPGSAVAPAAAATSIATGPSASIPAVATSPAGAGRGRGEGSLGVQLASRTPHRRSDLSGDLGCMTAARGADDAPLLMTQPRRYPLDQDGVLLLAPGAKSEAQGAGGAAGGGAGSAAVSGSSRGGGSVAPTMFGMVDTGVPPGVHPSHVTHLAAPAPGNAPPRPAADPAGHSATVAAAAITAMSAGEVTEGTRQAAGLSVEKAAEAAAGRSGSDVGGSASGGAEVITGSSNSPGGSGPAGSGTALGCGSDILDMRGVEDMALPPRPAEDGDGGGGNGTDPWVDIQAAGDGGDDDPLCVGGFVRLPRAATAHTPPAVEAEADIDGFDLVSGPPGAATPAVSRSFHPAAAAAPGGPGSGPSGVVLRRWGPSGAGSASGSLGSLAGSAVVATWPPPAVASGLVGTELGVLLQQQAGPAGGEVAGAGAAEGAQQQQVGRREDAGTGTRHPGPQQSGKWDVSAAWPDRRLSAATILTHQQLQQQQGHQQQKAHQQNQQERQQLLGLSMWQHPQLQSHSPDQVPPQGDLEDTTASQVYYSADYYAAASPYYGLDEYDQVYGYDTPAYGYADMASLGGPPAGGRPSAAMPESSAAELSTLPGVPLPGPVLRTQAQPLRHPHYQHFPQHSLQQQHQHQQHQHQQESHDYGLQSSRQGRFEAELRNRRGPSGERVQPADAMFEAQGPECERLNGSPGEAPAAGDDSAGSLRASLFGSGRGLGGGAGATSAAMDTDRATSGQTGLSGLRCSASGVMTLPTNETLELDRRVVRGHSLLQSLYMSNDNTVRDRMQQQLHARLIHAGRGGTGGGSELYGGASGGGDRDLVGVGELGASAATGRDGSGSGLGGGGDTGVAGGVQSWAEGSRGFGWAPPGAYL